MNAFDLLPPRFRSLRNSRLERAARFGAADGWTGAKRRIGVDGYLDGDLVAPLRRNVEVELERRRGVPEGIFHALGRGDHSSRKEVGDRPSVEGHGAESRG